MHMNLRQNGPQMGNKSVIYNTFNFNGNSMVANIAGQGPLENARNSMNVMHP